MLTAKEAKHGFVALMVVGATMSASAVRSDPVTFRIDPARSSAVAAGQVLGIEGKEQAPGSLTTSYGGDIVVDIDSLTAPTSITFLGGAANAETSGAWLPNDVLGSAPGQNAPGDPGDPAPANYGVQLNGGLLGTGWAAVRDLVLSLTSEVEPVVEGAFASSQTIEVTSGRFDYTLDSLFLGDEAGSEDVVGAAAENGDPANGTYDFDVDVATVTIPLMLAVTLEGDFSGELSFAGNLVATALLGDVNSDGIVNGLDVDPFVHALVEGPAILTADMNGDGAVNGLDVDPFVAAVIGGNVYAVAEPSTLALLNVLGLLALHAMFRPRLGRRTASR